MAGKHTKVKHTLGEGDRWAYGNKARGQSIEFYRPQESKSAEAFGADARRRFLF